MDTVYTVSELAKILKVSEWTIYQLCKSNQLSYFRVRGSIRISSAALTRYIRDGEHKSSHK